VFACRRRTQKLWRGLWKCGNAGSYGAIGIGATGATPGGCLTRVLHIIHVSTCNFSFAATLLCWPCCKNAKNKREPFAKKTKKMEKGKQGNTRPPKKKENVKKKEGQHPASKETCASDFICHY